MKCVIKLFCLAWMIALLTMGCATEQPWWKATPARWARADGAIATLQLHVTDDKGTPVEGATVWVNFWKPGSSEGNQAFGETDENGNVTLSERCYSDGWYGIEKDGYYRTRKRIVTPPYDSEYMEEGFIRLHWKKPFVSTESLRPIKNPCPMIAQQGIRLDVPETNVPLGFDLEKMDWVAPYGAGTFNDVYITITTQLKHVGKNDWPIVTVVTFNFPNNDDGMQVLDLQEWSRLNSVYHADSTLGFSQAIQFTGKEGTSRYDIIPRSKYIVFRVRTKRSPTGEIISAYYGKLYPWFDVTPETFSIMRGYFNPVPNDTNLEFDPERNLAPDETLEQHQRRRVYLP